MILKHVEITLVGPDDDPADEESLASWEEKEAQAREWFAYELEGAIVATRFRLALSGFDVEVSPDDFTKDPGVTAPSVAPGDSLA